ncbi:C3a anaphylatoxin chemotactic receptor-like [Rana temporaria]|uniref:C3a anaphylatoxin chemotactic receptor-like n=1 Tax=Rana temporaria TaxID=8407 RepID=UPI001AADD121|nr:C3a anaphylatoxin chemotactic receptor-like [Rana temporaria]
MFLQENKMSNVSDETGSPSFYNHRHLFTVVVFSFTTLIGVPGNALVLWVTGVKMKWTMTTIWFWNLAVADIMCCLCLPFIIAQFFYTDWLYGAVLCKIIPFIAPLNMFTSVFTLVAISVDRCILVVQPIWARNHRGVRKAWMTCFAIWMMSFIICIPKFLYLSFSTSNNTARCIPEEHIIVPNTYIYMVFGFLLPFLIISICYISVAFILHKRRFTEVGNKIIKVSLGIIVAFFITWAPYHIMGVVLLYTPNKVVLILDMFSQSLAMFNSCINPILYVFMGKDMKDKVRQSIVGLMQNTFSENSSSGTTRRTHLVNDDVLLE